MTDWRPIFQSCIKAKSDLNVKPGQKLILGLSPNSLLINWALRPKSLIHYRITEHVPSMSPNNVLDVMTYEEVAEFCENRLFDYPANHASFHDHFYMCMFPGFCWWMLNLTRACVQFSLWRKTPGKQVSKCWMLRRLGEFSSQIKAKWCSNRCIFNTWDW